MLRKEAGLYRNILVPLDGSPLAECVLPHVEAIAHGSDNPNIIFMRVIEMPAGMYTDLSEYQRTQVKANKIEEAKKYFEGLMSQIEYEGIAVKCEVIVAKVAEGIAEYARRNEVDLIVIATHGRTGIIGLVWGSIADQVLHTSSLPVLMIRPSGYVPVT